MSEGFDGQRVLTNISDQVAIQIWVDGDFTYIAKTKVGRDVTAAKWAIKRIQANISDGSSTLTKITWANGNPKFINPADDFAIISALPYS